MPLMKSKSKKASEEDMSMEKPKSLAAAYNVKRKMPKKMMAEGGRAGGAGHGKYQDQTEKQKGVHTGVSGVTEYSKADQGTSRAGDYTKDKYAGKPTFSGKDHPALKEHHRVLEESRKIHPKIQGLADGGEVKRSDYKRAQSSKEEGVHLPADHGAPAYHQEGKSSAGSNARSGMKTKARGVSDSENLSMKSSIMEHRNKLNELKSMPKPKIQGLADGGEVKQPQPQPAKPFMKSVQDWIDQPDPEQKTGSHPRPLDPDKTKVFQKGFEGYAEGGMVHDEEEIEHAASIAGAIMAKRRSAKMMAEGGMVDIESNGMEEADPMDDMNEASLKENYDEELSDMDQPMDSNEHSEAIDEDKHDMVSAIRAKMKMRSPITK